MRRVCARRFRFFPQGLSLWCLEYWVGGVTATFWSAPLMIGCKHQRGSPGTPCWIRAVASELEKSVSTR